jgi:hypothetical protein
MLSSKSSSDHRRQHTLATDRGLASIKEVHGARSGGERRIQAQGLWITVGEHSYGEGRKAKRERKEGDDK